MQPLIIFIRAIGIYALLTLPVLFSPIIYVISIGYVIIFGWIAFAFFFITYYLSCYFIKQAAVLMLLLSLQVIIGVVIAFHVLGLSDPSLDAWNSDGCLLFPAAGALAGIISLYVSKNKITQQLIQTINK